ncbi:protein FAM174C [Solea solea]|uniref:protein FAM174C n=1 Tax=Solea solea TaxID=90069 RepID=UPI00272DAC75|nr:protein FAM174C [Solea solea]
MTDRDLSALLLPLCSLFVSAAADADVTKTTAVTNSSGVNSTVSGGAGGQSRGGLFGGLDVDSSMMQRALYVLIGFTMIGLLYFLIRAVRLKKPLQRKKYGLLLNDSVEMEAVESEDDDNDTLFEARSLRR